MCSSSGCSDCVTSGCSCVVSVVSVVSVARIASIMSSSIPAALDALGQPNPIQIRRQMPRNTHPTRGTKCVHAVNTGSSPQYTGPIARPCGHGIECAHAASIRGRVRACRQHTGLSTGGTHPIDIRETDARTRRSGQLGCSRSRYCRRRPSIRAHCVCATTRAASLRAGSVCVNGR